LLNRGGPFGVTGDNRYGKQGFVTEALECRKFEVSHNVFSEFPRGVGWVATMHRAYESKVLTILSVKGEVMSSPKHALDESFVAITEFLLSETRHGVIVAAAEYKRRVGAFECLRF
jgi:hypothetical protein